MPTEDDMPMAEELPGFEEGGGDFPSIGVLVVGGGIHAAGEAIGPIVSHPVVIGAVSTGIGAAVTGAAIVPAAVSGAVGAAVTAAMSGADK